MLDRTENGDGQGNAWCEFGDIDSEGHTRGWKLAKHIDPLLAEIAERITALLAAGWNSVRVVTDRLVTHAGQATNNSDVQRPY